MKIKILTGFDDGFLKIGTLSSQRLINICEKRGYGYRIHRGGFDPERAASWSKIRFLREAIQEGGITHVMWIDADAFILRDDFAPEAMLVEGKAFYIAKDSSGINAGILLVEASDYVVDLLDAVYAQTQFIDHHWWEQRAIMHLIEENWSGIQSRIEYVPARLWNSRFMFLYDNCSSECAVTEESMILHLPGVSNDVRERVFDDLSSGKPLRPIAVRELFRHRWRRLWRDLRATLRPIRNLLRSS